MTIVGMDEAVNAIDAFFQKKYYERREIWAEEELGELKEQRSTLRDALLTAPEYRTQYQMLAVEEDTEECEREERIGIINDRKMFNDFRLYYTRLRHSGRARRHFIHYIIRMGVWSRTERRGRRDVKC